MKEENHVFQGLKRDNHQIRQKSEFLWDAHNIRLTNREDNTLLSITNEKGTSGPLSYFLKSYVGHCVLGKYLVVFTANETSGYSYIYRVDKVDDTYNSVILYEGNLNLSPKHPIEALGIYETEFVQKVYWVDGVNQPRVINIAKENSNYNENSFNFVQNLKLEEKIGVLKIHGDGMFSPGVIQYAFTYYNKYGQESNIFYTTPINYISPKDRGGSPEEKVSNLFRIDISSVDTNFEYLRIYSIHRTSIDAVPTVKLLTDILISNIESNDYTVSFTDTGTIGEAIDPMTLLYIGGKDIVASTMCAKDNTLFLGNISQKDNQNWIAIKDIVSNWISLREWGEIVNTVNTQSPFFGEYYAYNPQLKSPGFKSGETYRCGIQFQSKTGVWSDPVWLRDIVLNGKYPYATPNSSIGYSKGVELKAGLIEALQNYGYIKARACVVLPSNTDRTIIGQGVLCPTVFSTGARKTNSPYAMSSWFFRPQVDALEETFSNDSLVYKGANIQSLHNYALYTGPNRGAEIQCTTYNPEIKIIGDVTKDNFQENIFFVDSNLVTFHSPEIEFGTSIHNFNLDDNLELKILGSVGMEASIGDIDIQTSSPTASSIATGFEHKLIGYQYGDTTGTLAKNGGLVAGLFYQDGIVRETGIPGTEVYHMVYPWHRSGSLNNGANPTEEEGKPARARSAVLSKKRLSNLKFFNKFYPIEIEKDEEGNAVWDGTLDIGTPQLFSSQEVSLVKVWVDYLGKEVPYYGNIDTLIPATSEGYSLYKSETFSGAVGEVLNNTTETNPFIIKSQDPVRIKYKSTPHLVFSLKGETSKYIEILPTKGNATSQDGNGYTIPDWDETTGAENNDSNTEGGNYPELVFISNETTGSPSEARAEQVGGYAYLLNNPGFKKSFLKATKIGTSQANNGWNYLAAKNSLAEGTIFKVIGDGARCMIKGNEVIDTGNSESYTFYNGETKYFKLVNVSTSTSNNVLTGDLEEIAAPEDVIASRAASIGDTFSISQKKLNSDGSDNPPFLVLAELRRKSVTNRFGGDSEEALQSNLWIPAGDPVNLTEVDNTGSVYVKYQYGDTWYSRYDCLKTYPFTQEDENSIVEIGSFMVETRVNIDGRYDRNRGQLSNLNMSPTNFNVLNEVYSQKNNFFNYRIYEDSYYKTSKFTNQITWSLEKSLNAEVDTWTNITLANTLDLIGDQGTITSLKVWNENILCFQERGLSQILFNSRVQIPVTDGVPIEISNGYKVDGSRSLSNIIGCTNKWSIATTPYGVYFIDANTKSIYLYNGQLNNLSRDKGMDWWVKSNNPSNIWSATKSSISDYGIRTFYDNIHGDVYFTPGYVDNIQPEALCYSETLGQFTSLMSYGGVLAMFNLEGQSYSLYQDLSNRDSLSLYKNFEGDYNYFFKGYKGWDFSFIANENPTYTKVFDTIELRTDLYNEKGELKNSCPVNFLRVSNEYQDSSQIAVDTKNMRKKFRIWRGLLPRNKDTRQRIRNPWSMITLGWKPSITEQADNINKAIVHDVSVKYTV